MAENTAIEWADHTFNPWIGCTKVGPGCDRCYAEILATTRLAAVSGPGAPRRRTAASTWQQPHRWIRAGKSFTGLEQNPAYLATMVSRITAAVAAAQERTAA